MKQRFFVSEFFLAVKTFDIVLIVVVACNHHFPTVNLNGIGQGSFLVQTAETLKTVG